MHYSVVKVKGVKYRFFFEKAANPQVKINGGYRVSNSKIADFLSTNIEIWPNLAYFG